MHDSYTMQMHAIGVPEGVTLLEFEPVLPEEQQQAQELEVQTPEEGASEVLECRSPTFLFSERQAPEHSKSPMFLQIS